MIDLTDCQVTPGMIDAHMHMDYFDWHTVREEVYTQSEEAKTLAIARCAEKALRRGFTTVPRWRYHQQRIWRSGCKTRH